jgi:DNA mismatch repair protein MutS2
MPDYWGIELNSDIVEFLDLHFLHIHDVEDAIEKHLNDNFLGKNKYVAFIHGFGTGKLKAKVNEVIKDHPLVENYWIAQHGPSAGGVTYAILKT